ncbi:MAG: 23S rRNA (pseudouridine(1915)-N(3))-methyltransferase RlmH [Oscillospiraceae bacterium]|nr:23S rRNA (pseudouridine(1915)-N(3))-methyltransferase RlmH [Oscillospiraceae bacterium]
MLSVRLICVGKMREKFYTDAFAEYTKRLGAYCKFEHIELNEQRLSDSPSSKEISSALEKEASDISKNIPDTAFTVAMCVEGKQMPSEKLAALIKERELSGRPKICFIIGGSFGLDESIKKRADLRLSMSEMTFPHHLARVMLAEQIYRGFKINEGSRYHK